MINLLARTVARESTIDEVYNMSLPPQGKGSHSGAGSSRKPAQTKNPKPPKKPSPKKPSTKKHNWMIKGTGALIQRIEPSQISETSVEVSSDVPFDLLCSYNWHLETKTSSIYVPGRHAIPPVSSEFNAYSFPQAHPHAGSPLQSPSRFPETRVFSAST